MRAKLRAWSRYRPRALTLVVFLLAAAVLVLSNLSSERGGSHVFRHKSYGWPLIWHRFVTRPQGYGTGSDTVGWYYSATRLAADVAMSLTMLGATTGACEWLLRRYRPRLRWSLKTMLAAVALAAAFCAWFAAALDRAKVQDEVIAELGGPSFAPPYWISQGVRVERWGPKWLDLVGADRFRRRIVCVDLIDNVRVLHAGDAADEQLLKWLARLPDLRCMSLEVNHLSPAMVAALNDMRKLQRLKISRNPDHDGDVPPISNARLAPLGKMTHLSELEIDNLTVDAESLAGLDNLKSLKMSAQDWFPVVDRDGEGRIWHESLVAIGKCAQIEHLQLSGENIYPKPESLACLAGLTNLKSLSLEFGTKQPPMLSALPRLAGLDALTLRSAAICDDDLGCLERLPSLKSLDLAQTSVMPAGLAKLTSLPNLDDVSLGSFLTSDNEVRDISTADLASLSALKHLTRVHLADGTDWATVERDALGASDEEAVAPRRALLALRNSHPGIIIDNGSDALPFTVFCDGECAPGYDAIPYRHETWLPASDAPQMTPAVRAAFEQGGGWARFDAAGWRLPDGSEETVTF